MAPGDRDVEQAIDARPMLQRIWTFFLEKGRWPTTFELDKVLYRDVDIALTEAVKQLPPGLLSPTFERWTHVWQPDKNTTVSLTVAGLDQIDAGEPYVESFIRALTHLVARAAAFDPPEAETALTITEAELDGAIGAWVAPHVIQVVEMLLNTDTPSLWQGMSQDPWSITLNEIGARHYDKVATIDDFIALRAQDRADYNEQMYAMRASPSPFSTSWPAPDVAMSGDVRRIGGTTLLKPRMTDRPWVRVIGSAVLAVLVGLVIAYLTGALHLDR